MAHIQRNILGGLCALLTSLFQSHLSAETYSEVITTGGSLGGVNSSTEARISGGGAAFSQRLHVGLSGDAGPSVFSGGGIQFFSTVANTTSIGGGKIISNQNVLQADFMIGDNSAGRRVELGTDASGRGQLRLRDSAGNIAVNILAGGFTTILGVAGASGTEATAAIRAGNVGALNKFVAIGYDSVADVGYIQALHSGTTNKPLRLQPNSNVVTIGSDPGGNDMLRIEGGIRTGGRNTRLGAIPLTLGYSGNGYPDVGYNIYRDASATQTRINADYASKIDFGNNNRISLMIAPSGAAGAAISWNTAWMVDANSGVMTIIGTPPDTAADGTVKIGGGRVMVGGILSAKEIRVTTSGADYIFADDYELMPLSKVEAFVKEKRHLPGIEPAAAMQKNGMDVSDQVTRQLAKIEELTLYMINESHKRQALEKQVEHLMRQNALLMVRLGLADGTQPAVK